MDLPAGASSAEPGEFNERPMGLALCPTSDGSMFKRLGMARWMRRRSVFYEEGLYEVMIIKFEL